ncbi:MAG: response regulator transcription factor [Bacteroidota bacterium]
MKKIVLVDDHQIVLDGLRCLLKDEKDIEITREVLRGKAAIEAVKQEAVDIVLLDINLPDQNGFEVCKHIKAYDNSIKVLALTMYSETGYISKMIKYGVDGYILKNTDRREILTAINCLLLGENYFSPEVSNRILLRKNKTKSTRNKGFIQPVTRREKEVLQLIVDEYTTDEIATKLFISPTTVVTHRKSLLRKLDAKNTAGLVKTAYEFNLLDLIRNEG